MYNDRAVFVAKRLNDKMAAKKGSGFPYKFASFILIVFIGGVIYYDIVKHGSWEKSRTYTGLKDAGVLEYSNKALDRTSQGLHWAHQRVDEQFPGYYEKSSEFLQPYLQVTKECGLVLSNVFVNLKDVAVEKYPAVVASIESYAPGLLEQSQKAVYNAWSTSVLYFNRSVDYLKTEVFVGQLAPENMQRVVLEAFNTTQQKAAECYYWIYEKVHSTIK